MLYLLTTLELDPLTLVIIGSGLLAPLITSQREHVPLSLGALLYLLVGATFGIKLAQRVTQAPEGMVPASSETGSLGIRETHKSVKNGVCLLGGAEAKPCEFGDPLRQSRAYYLPG